MSQHIRPFRATLPALMAGLILPLVLLTPAVAVENNIDQEIEKVLRERLAVLQEAAKLRREGYQAGEVTLTSALASDQDVLQAELELAKSVADRVRIREETLKTAETIEKAVAELVKRNESPRTDLLSARANRLRVSADLMLERKAATR